MAAAATVGAGVQPGESRRTSGLIKIGGGHGLAISGCGLEIAPTVGWPMSLGHGGDDDTRSGLCPRSSLPHLQRRWATHPVLRNVVGHAQVEAGGRERPVEDVPSGRPSVAPPLVGGAVRRFSWDSCTAQEQWHTLVAHKGRRYVPQQGCKREGSLKPAPYDHRSMYRCRWCSVGCAHG